LSRLPAAAVQPDMPEFPDDHKRGHAATVGDIRFICFYVPNGQSVGSEKYQLPLVAVSFAVTHRTWRFPLLSPGAGVWATQMSEP